ncbi:MAG: hypothetical protein ABJD24_00020 [Acidimicrobiales bacterium]
MRGIVAATAAVAVLAGGIAFGVSRLASADGAGSPEAAVRQFFDAITKRDMVGVLDALPPGERESIKEPVVELATELKRLGVLSNTFELNNVSGLDFSIANLTLKTDDVRSDLAVVEITGGSLTTTVDMAKVPFGSLIDDIAFDGKRPNDAKTTTSDMAEGDNLRLATVKQDGGWHVSLWYSIAEAARKSAGLPMPALADAIAAIGTDTPDAAVEELIAAALNLDLRRIIELTPPDETRALHEYAPLFLNDAQQSAQKFKKDNEVSISLDKLETSVTGTGSTRQVAVTAFAVSGNTADGAFLVAHDGTCTTFTFPGDAKPTKTCAADAQAELDTLGLGALSSLATLDKTLGVTVVEVDGHWYVSPTRTSMELFVGMLRPLDQKKLRDIITSFEGMMTPKTHFEIIGDAVDSSVGSTSASTIPSVYGRCYIAADPAACFADALSSGEITATDVPVEFRFDCFGTYLDDRVNMSVTELAAAATEVHDCLQPHIVAGEINIDDLEAELAKPECIGDINPYSPEVPAKDSDAELNRLYDCAYVG